MLNNFGCDETNRSVAQIWNKLRQEMYMDSNGQLLDYVGQRNELID